MNVQVDVWMKHGKWHIQLKGPRWMVDEMSEQSYQGAVFYVSGSSIFGGSGPTDHNATITLELRQPYVPKTEEPAVSPGSAEGPQANDH